MPIRLKTLKTYGLLLLAMLLTACHNELDGISTGVLPGDEMITLFADTFHVQAENVFADYIYSRSDSFLLGNYQDDDEFGNTRAEILAQFAAPEGYAYPSNAVLDSICVYVYYTSWYGYPKSSLHVEAYLMDKGTFKYSSRYKSNLNPKDYCTMNTLLGEQFVSPSHPADSIADSNGDYYKYMTLRISSDKAQAFFNRARNGFSTQTEFCDFFNGIYFTTDFGSSCMLYVSQIDFTVYYHYQISYTDINGQQQTKQNNDSKTYPANAEVRQINVFSHSDRDKVIQRLNQVKSLSYVASPANIYSSLHLPTRQILDTIQQNMGNRRPYVNGAYLKVELVDVDTNDMATAPDYMLLVKRTQMNNFFDKGMDTNDTCAILGSLAYDTDSAGTTITGYYYSFDLSGYLNSELRVLNGADPSERRFDTPQEEKPSSRMSEAEKQELNKSYNNWCTYWELGCTDWVLIPVELETTTSSSSTTITDVRNLYTMSATRLRNGRNSVHPMRISVAYTGF